jgi:hypothetical protein
MIVARGRAAASTSSVRSPAGFSSRVRTGGGGVLPRGIEPK